MSPTIVNPEPFPVFCLPLRAVLAAGEECEATEDQALAASESSVFRVHGLGADADAEAAAKAEAEAEAAKAAEAQGAADAAAKAEVEAQAAAVATEAQRVAVQRGGQVVEQTGAPAAETR